MILIHILLQVEILLVMILLALGWWKCTYFLARFLLAWWLSLRRYNIIFIVNFFATLSLWLISGIWFMLFIWYWSWNLLFILSINWKTWFNLLLEIRFWSLRLFYRFLLWRQSLVLFSWIINLLRVERSNLRSILEWILTILLGSDIQLWWTFWYLLIMNMVDWLIVIEWVVIHFH